MKVNIYALSFFEMLINLVVTKQFNSQFTDSKRTIRVYKWENEWKRKQIY